MGKSFTYELRISGHTYIKVKKVDKITLHPWGFEVLRADKVEKVEFPTDVQKDFKLEKPKRRRRMRLFPHQRKSVKEEPNPGQPLHVDDTGARKKLKIDSDSFHLTPEITAIEITGQKGPSIEFVQVSKEQAERDLLYDLSTLEPVMWHQERQFKVLALSSIKFESESPRDLNFKRNSSNSELKFKEERKFDNTNLNLSREGNSKKMNGPEQEGSYTVDGSLNATWNTPFSNSSYYARKREEIKEESPQIGKPPYMLEEDLVHFYEMQKKRIYWNAGIAEWRCSEEAAKLWEDFKNETPRQRREMWMAHLSRKVDIICRLWEKGKIALARKEGKLVKWFASCGGHTSLDLNHPEYDKHVPGRAEAREKGVKIENGLNLFVKK